MSDRHFANRSRFLPHHLTIPATSLFYNLEVSAQRFPEKPFLIFYDTKISFARFKSESERLAVWLNKCGIGKGDRVLLYLQNSPQFAIAFYAILRANAVAVPVNPMNLPSELRHLVSDSGAKVALVAQDLYSNAKALLGETLDQILLVTYSDYLEEPTDLPVPAFIRAPRDTVSDPRVVAWAHALCNEAHPAPLSVGPEDLCVLIYTSGTTGRPKGCMHTHRGAMYTAIAGMQWFGVQQDAVQLAVLPLFHVSGLQFCLNGPMYSGSTVVILPRWDRDAAAMCIQRYRVTFWTTIPAMVVNLLDSSVMDTYDLTSLQWMMGGGAAMPAAVARDLADRGIPYIEGYGLSETMGPTHINPRDRTKQQCLGTPIFDTESIVVDVESLQRIPAGDVGEIVIRGPQVFAGYWQNAAASAEALVEIDGVTWLRTGDLGRVDDEGYFYMVDRLKRMINASGFKVWPAEVESLMYRHPAIQEACVIAGKDMRRGETVKAVIVLKADFKASITEKEIMEWARTEMAAYKSPRIIVFVDQLPKTATGKIAWRLLQEREDAA